MFSSEMGQMENAGLPRRVAFHRPDRPLVAQMSGTDGEPVRPPPELSQWDFIIKYQRGSENLLAGTLSRQPIPTCEISNQKDWYHRRKKVVEEDPKSHPEYTARDGRLFRNILHTLDFNDTDPGDQLKVCIPRVEQANILKEEHDEPTAGHLGLAKTLARLARQYYWPGMLRMAAKYVRTCASCQKHKVQQQAAAAVQPGKESQPSHKDDDGPKCHKKTSRSRTNTYQNWRSPITRHNTIQPDTQWTTQISAEN